MASEKTCFKCKTIKPMSEFYRHSKMADGYLNKCKTCAKQDANTHRALNIDYVLAYDRARGNLPHRVAARKEYSLTEAGKSSHAKATKKWKKLHPDRRKASVAVNNALRDKRLKKLPCLICGKKAQAHHPDYDSPLDVVWLCSPHHKQAHALAK